MRPFRPFAIALVLASVACSQAPTGEALSERGPNKTLAQCFGRSAAMKLDIADADLVQRTCALYVAVRSHAWKDQIGFGRDMDSAMVRWNTCPGGTMVACTVVPTANGDSVITGIPLH